MMTLLVGLRNTHVGGDTHNYVDFANDTNDFNGRFGVIYDVIKSISMGLVDSPNSFLMALAILTFIPLICLLVRISKERFPGYSGFNLSCALLIYLVSVNRLYLETFNICRQSIAIVFVLIALHYFAEDNIKKGIVFYLIAIVFHKIVLVAFPFFFLLNIKFSKPVVYIALAVSLIIGFSGTLNFFISLLGALIGNAELFSSYLLRDLTTGWGLGETLAHCLPVTFLCILAYGRVKGEYYNSVYNFLFFGAVLCNLMITNKFVDRFTSTFTIAQILIIPLALMKARTFVPISQREGELKVKKTRFFTRRRLVMCLVIILVAYFTRNLILDNAQKTIDDNWVVPYSFCFQ